MVLYKTVNYVCKIFTYWDRQTQTQTQTSVTCRHTV